MKYLIFLVSVSFLVVLTACAGYILGEQSQGTAYPPPGDQLETLTPPYPEPPTVEPPYPEPTQQPLLTPSRPVPTTLTSPTPLQRVTPSITPTPLASPTPTPLFYALEGTPIPPDLHPITAINAAQTSALAEWQEGAPITDLAFFPDGRDLAVANGTEISLYDIFTRERFRQLYPRDPGVREIAISPNRAWLVSGSVQGSESSGYVTHLERWHGPDWRPAGVFAVAQRGLADVDFSPDGWSMAVAYTSPDEQANSVDFWDLFTWEISNTLKSGIALDLAYSPDGRMLAVSPDRYAVQVWALDKLDKPRFKLLTSFTGAVNDLAYSPGGLFLATGHYDGEIRIWDMSTGQRVLTIPTGSAVGSLSYNADGTLIASGGTYEDSLIRLWDARTGELLRTLEGHSSGVSELQFSPDARLLVSASYDGALRLWGIRP